jgi:hypothetical protein
MPDTTFRFHAYLNRFLSPDRRETAFSYPFDGMRSVKDMIEAVGIPHTEVHLILVNGNPQSFAYHVQAGDQIDVYPEAAAKDHRPIRVTDARFVADVHLGRLAAYLRMIGFDTLYPDDYRDEILAQVAADESRILLTRDAGLLKRKVVARGYYVHATDPWKQLTEVLHRFDLAAQARGGQPRCTACNGLLYEVEKALISDRIQPKTREFFDEFRECSVCHKIYWKGSHYKQMNAYLATLHSEIS